MSSLTIPVPEIFEAAGNSPVVKALSLLEGVVASSEPVALAQLAAAYGLPKPTAHRLAQMLEREGYLRREPGSRRFVVGARLVNLALDVLGAAVHQGPSHAILVALAEEIGETCGLGVMVGSEIVVIDDAKAGWPLALEVGVRARLPLHCSAMGKLLLSFMPRRSRDRLLASLKLERYTETTLSDRAALLEELERIRVERVAVNNQEFIAGVIGVAVPVYGPRRRVCASISVGAPEARMTLDRALTFVPALQRAAERMSECFVAAASAEGDE